MSKEEKMLKRAIEYLAKGKTCPDGEKMNHCDYISCSECWAEHLEKESEENNNEYNT